MPLPLLPLTAILIQDIRDYILYIKKPLIESINSSFSNENINEITKWIIEEELELIYGLFVNGHQHNKYPNHLIHNTLNRLLYGNLSKITRWYIKSPKLYDFDTAILLNINDTDLIIEYYTKIPKITITKY